MVKVLWEEMSRPEIEEVQKRPNAVILPTGSTEQHSYHLPVNVDARCVSYIAEQTARKVADEQEPSTQINKFKIKYENLFERLTKLIWFNKIGLGKRKITKKEICEELDTTVNTFNKFLKMPPRAVQETKQFKKKVEEEAKKPNDPLGLLDKKKS